MILQVSPSVFVILYTLVSATISPGISLFLIVHINNVQRNIKQLLTVGIVCTHPTTWQIGIGLGNSQAKEADKGNDRQGSQMHDRDLEQRHGIGIGKNQREIEVGHGQ